MADELKTERIQVLLSPTNLRAIDDWSFHHRIRSRGEAIRQLIHRGYVFDDAEDFLEVSIDLLEKVVPFDRDDIKEIEQKYLVACRKLIKKIADVQILSTQSNALLMQYVLDLQRDDKDYKVIFDEILREEGLTLDNVKSAAEFLKAAAAKET